MKSSAITLSLLVAGAAACTEQNVNLGGNYIVAADVPPIETRAIDLLFVIDNSGSMLDNQAQLAAKAQEALFDVLDAAMGGPPDLHVGVITPDMGTLGVTADPGCNPDPADHGRLQVGTCAVDGAYLIDVDDGAGGRTRNYQGALEEAFGCMAQVGAEGCGFEQPLAAVRASFDHEANAGFLRPDALLVIVILTDEDDCSAYEPALFDPGRTELGGMISYRCFRAGMTCDEPLDVEGEKHGCAVQEASAYLTDLGELAGAFVAAKPDPAQVMVSVFRGLPGPINVAPNPTSGMLDLGSTCVDADGGGVDPALRLDKFLDYFPGRSWQESICDPVDTTLRRTANSVADIAVRRSCLRGALKDLDDAPGLQPSCRVFLSEAPQDAAAPRRELTSCDDTDGGCFRIVQDATCGHATGLAVQLNGITPAPTDHVLVECLLP